MGSETGTERMLDDSSKVGIGGILMHHHLDMKLFYSTQLSSSSDNKSIQPNHEPHFRSWRCRWASKAWPILC